MARWVKCSPLGSEQSLYVNLDRALIISSQSRGSVITYAGDDGSTSNCAVVTETPEEIFASKPVEYTYPNRS